MPLFFLVIVCYFLTFKRHRIPTLVTLTFAFVHACVCSPTVHIDISRVFNSVLPQQCQPADSFTGAQTICAIYTKW